jgi:hypothetical protein
MVVNQWPEALPGARPDDAEATWTAGEGTGADAGSGSAANCGSTRPGTRWGAGSTRNNPGRRIDAGDTECDPLNPPHPENKADRPRAKDAAKSRER